MTVPRWQVSTSQHIVMPLGGQAWLVAPARALLSRSSRHHPRQTPKMPHILLLFLCHHSGPLVVGGCDAKESIVEGVMEGLKGIEGEAGALRGM